MKFKSNKETDKKLNELACFLDEKIDIMKNLQDSYKENSIEYFWCDGCEKYIHGSKLEWRNDTPICPNCGSKINI